jgi:hypothetical protein
MSPVEKHVDWDFVLPCFKTWEMALVETLTWICPIAETALYWRYVGGGGKEGGGEGGKEGGKEGGRDGGREVQSSVGIVFRKA